MFLDTRQFGSKPQVATEIRLVSGLKKMGGFGWKMARIADQVSRDEWQDAVVLGKRKEAGPVEDGVSAFGDARDLRGAGIGGGAGAKEMEVIATIQRRGSRRGEHSFNH
jgi:hypothetical protein